MKKLLLLLLAFPLFIACSSSSSDDDNKNELQYVRIKVTSDDAVSPTGIVALFYLGDEDITNIYYVGSLGIWDGTVVATRGDGESIFPVSKISGDKTVANKDYSVHSFYWNELSSIYGIPQAGKKYAIFVQLGIGNKPRAYKVITIDKNKDIEVHLPSADKISQLVEANWIIKDF